MRNKHHLFRAQHLNVLILTTNFEQSSPSPPMALHCIIHCTHVDGFQLLATTLVRLPTIACTWSFIALPTLGPRSPCLILRVKIQYCRCHPCQQRRQWTSGLLAALHMKSWQDNHCLAARSLMRRSWQCSSGESVFAYSTEPGAAKAFSKPRESKHLTEQAREDLSARSPSSWLTQIARNILRAYKHIWVWWSRGLMVTIWVSGEGCRDGWSSSSFLRLSSTLINVY